MYAAIRIRGNVNLNRDLVKTLESLMLTKVNQLVLIPEDKQNRKMLDTARAYITYGEASKEMLAKLIEKRGKVLGDKKVDAEVLKKAGFKNIEELADAVSSGKINLRETGVKPVFRLRPPRKGHARGGIKKDFTVGGALGYRGEAINQLIGKMI